MNDPKTSALPPASGSAIRRLKEDHRPQKGWWADGHYMNRCFQCGETSQETNALGNVPTVPMQARKHLTTKLSDRRRHNDNVHKLRQTLQHHHAV